jgi:hypothetical protein
LIGFISLNSQLCKFFGGNTTVDPIDKLFATYHIDWVHFSKSQCVFGTKQQTLIGFISLIHRFATLFLRNTTVNAIDKLFTISYLKLTGLVVEDMAGQKTQPTLDLQFEGCHS